jgi:hypothetical protein
MHTTTENKINLYIVKWLKYMGLCVFYPIDLCTIYLGQNYAFSYNVSVVKKKKKLEVKCSNSSRIILFAQDGFGFLKSLILNSNSKIMFFSFSLKNGIGI